MAATLRLRTSQLQSALRLLREAREVGGSGGDLRDVGERRHVVTGLCEILGAVGVVSCEAGRLADGTKTFTGIESGRAANEHSEFGRWLVIPEVDDPSATRHMVEMNERRAVEPNTALRRDLLDDQSWYASEYVADVRRPGRIDDSICSMRPGTRPRSFHGLVAVRAWGDPPFTEEDRDLLHVVHLEWSHASSAAPPVSSSIDESNLAPRESEVLRHLASGFSYKEIASRMNLSVYTVNDYCKRLYRKLGVHSRAELQALVAKRR